MIGDLFDSPWKILIVAVVLIVLFGSAKLPVAARSLGKSMRILKTEVQGLHEEEDTKRNSATPTLAPTGTQQTITSQQQLAAQLAQRQIDDPGRPPTDLKGPAEGQPDDHLRSHLGGGCCNQNGPATENGPVAPASGTTGPFGI
jgi:sec-independent protein translocase protein TatA